jgi:cytochrome bd-type quinol oxidase subunit 2
MCHPEFRKRHTFSRFLFSAISATVTIWNTYSNDVSLDILHSVYVCFVCFLVQMQQCSYTVLNP